MSCIFCETRDADNVYKTQNFLVKIGRAVIAPGHVMIIPKEHYPCYGALPEKLVPEYLELKERVTRIITEKFSKPFLLEYGIWGQTVNHAHIHVIPARGPGYEVKSIMQEMALPSGIRHEQADMKRLKEIYISEGVYGSIEENRRMFVFHVRDVPDDKNWLHLKYRGFFMYKKGLKGVGTWKNMSEEDKKLDIAKRKETERILENAFPESED